MTPTLLFTLTGYFFRVWEREREREAGRGLMVIHQVLLDIVNVQWLSLKYAVGNDGRQCNKICL